MSKISEITPIEDGMTKEEAKEATKAFLLDVLQPENELLLTDIARMDNIQGDRRGYSLVTLKDGTQWVKATNAGLERVIGEYYLNKHLPSLSFKNWEAASTKFLFVDPKKTDEIKCNIKSATASPLKNLLTIQSDNFISFSKYAGETKPRIELKCLEQKDEVQAVTGYKEFGSNSNLRIGEGDTIIIIDTEYQSFSSEGVTLVSAETNLELAGLEFSYPVDEILGS